MYLLIAHPSSLLIPWLIATTGADLNEFVWCTSYMDEWTLLILACHNDHLDAVQRLLTTGSVDVNAPSKYQGLSPLYIASR
jgi:hypothetical protein